MSLGRGAAAVLAFVLLGAMPHVKTAGYYESYTVIPSVSLDDVARWLTWAETDTAHANELAKLGVKTMLYTDPNRTQIGDADYTSTASAFAHDCAGNPIFRNYDGKPQYLMNPHSSAILAQWRWHVRRYMAAAHFNAVFEDESDTIADSGGTPCNYNAASWTTATVAMQGALGAPVIFNNPVVIGQGASERIAQNATAIGGMLEGCYTDQGEPEASGWRWRNAEEDERLMAAAHKLFFCYTRNVSPAAASIQSRLYAYASFLLTYDPETSVLWEYYSTPSNFRVMPEVQLVPMSPEPQHISSIDDLKAPTGVYRRIYRSCFFAGKPIGRCLIAVNSDLIPHQLNGAREFSRTLQLSGAGIEDGGVARVAAVPPPSELAPLSAVIAFH